MVPADVRANPGFLQDAISPGGTMNDPNLTGQTYPGGGNYGDGSAAGEGAGPFYDPRLKDMAGMSKAQMERLGEPGNEFRQMELLDREGRC